MTRPPLARQIAWARGQASQHRRIAARNAPGSTAHAAALDRAAVAEAAVATLQSLPRRRPMPAPGGPQTQDHSQ